MRIIKKCIEAIKDGQLIYKVHRHLFITRKFYKLYNFISKWQKINEKKIVFVSYYGAGYGDNPKAIADYIIENNLNFELVWLLDTNKNDGLDMPKEVKKVKYGSIRSLYELSTAKVWVDNCRKQYFPKKKKGQIYIQTWHGSLALKKIEADAPSLPIQYVNMAKNDSSVIDVILSGCEFKTNVYKNSFWYSGEVLNIGTPRADVFFNEEKVLQNKKKVLDFYNLEDDAKILMYAPTFRQSHNLDIYKLDYSKLESVLVHKFGEKWKIIVRLHPNIAHLADELQLPNTVLNVTSYKDMQELLCASDIVVTDYSGLMFDFYIMNRPLFLFCTDLEEYTSKDRELYFDFKELPFDLAKSNGELCDRIKEFDYQKYLSNVEIFRKKIGFCEKGTSCIDLFNWIKKNIRIFK